MAVSPAREAYQKLAPANTHSGLAPFADDLRIVVVFDQLGPYHVARLDALGQRAKVTALEIADQSSEYPWAKVRETSNFTRRTIFSESTSRTIAPSRLKREIWTALDRARPDVVALPGWSDRAALASLIWCVRTGTPAVVMSASTAIDAERHWLVEAVKSRIVSLMGAGLGGGKRSSEYLAVLGMPKNRIFVGYDVVDNAHFAQGAEAARKSADIIRKQLDLPASYFLACSRFIPKKNLHGLVGAFARYRKDREAADWKLVLVGDGELRTEVLAQVRDLGITDEVKFTGYIDYRLLPSYYGLAGAFVHASTVEQWGLVVNEAMAAGLPVLVSERCGCAPDLVENGTNGFTFDPNDNARLAALMGHLSETGIAERMGSASAQIIRRWTPEVFAENLLQAAAAAIEAGPARRRPADSLLLAVLSNS